MWEVWILSNLDSIVNHRLIRSYSTFIYCPNYLVLIRSDEFAYDFDSHSSSHLQMYLVQINHTSRSGRRKIHKTLILWNSINPQKGLLSCKFATLQPSLSGV